MLDIVITMAGLGSRFKKAGYQLPKYMIEAHGKTLFEWSMLSLKDYEANQYIFIVRKEDDAVVFIKEQCIKLGIQKHYVIEIDYLTDGQASTAMLADSLWIEENALLIYNIDTYVESGYLLNEHLKGDGFIPCFRGKGEHWSFVKLNNAGNAAEVKEKERISDYCTIGAYYFRSCRLFKELYDNYYSDKHNTKNGEKYVAPLYNYLIQQGGIVKISDIPSKAVHVLGTPEELQEFIDT